MPRNTSPYPARDAQAALELARAELTRRQRRYGERDARTALARVVFENRARGITFRDAPPDIRYRVSD